VGLKERLKTFAADLTALNQGLAKLAKPGSKDEKGGPLAGNSGITGLSMALSTAYSSGFRITGASGANNIYRWADLGLEVNRDGSVAIRQADLDKAVDGITSGYGSNREIGKEMLGGFTSTIRSVLESFRGAAGTIQGSIEVLQTNRSRLGTNVTELESRVERSRKTLIAKYAALDAKLAGMTQLSSRVQSSLRGLQG
jgi:flagellar capping protein FliD